MRHLITGGAGFLGSHLADRLIEKGEEVIVLDSLFTGSRKSIVHLLDDHRFEFVRGDVCDPFHFEVDRIWHLACPASPIHYQHNAVRTLETGTIGTFNALRLAHKVKARILVASTSECYGDPVEHPQKESYRGNVNHLGPRACYDTAKCATEAIASTYSRQYDVEVRIPRIFNCYGPRMAESDGRVVSSFICQALRGQPLTIFGEGNQTRSFIYVDDLVRGLMLLMEKDIETQAVNVGNPTEFTIKELGDLIQQMIAPVGYNRQPLPVDDPTRRKPDITRAQQLLDWTPRVKLEDGLRLTIDWFYSQIHKSSSHDPQSVTVSR